MDRNLTEWELIYSQFNVDGIYSFIEETAKKHNMSQTLAALPYVMKAHAGQLRKGECELPYVIHPLTVAAHALSLQIFEDSLVAACLCHDVCEDCVDERGERIRPGDLPIGEAAKTAVEYVTKNKETIYHENEYYKKIKTDRLAMLVKILDRCHNISKMATGFSRERINAYITETEDYVFPLIDAIENEYPTYKNAMFLVRYHMLAVMESLKRYV